MQTTVSSFSNTSAAAVALLYKHIKLTQALHLLFCCIAVEQRKAANAAWIAIGTDGRQLFKEQKLKQRAAADKGGGGDGSRNNSGGDSGDSDGSNNEDVDDDGDGAGGDEGGDVDPVSVLQAQAAVAASPGDDDGDGAGGDEGGDVDHVSLLQAQAAVAASPDIKQTQKKLSEELLLSLFKTGRNSQRFGLLYLLVFTEAKATLIDQNSRLSPYKATRALQRGLQFGDIEPPAGHSRWFSMLTSFHSMFNYPHAESVKIFLIFARAHPSYFSSKHCLPAWLKLYELKGKLPYWNETAMRWYLLIEKMMHCAPKGPKQVQKFLVSLEISPLPLPRPSVFCSAHTQYETMAVSSLCAHSLSFCCCVKFAVPRRPLPPGLLLMKCRLKLKEVRMWWKKQMRVELAMELAAVVELVGVEAKSALPR
jgi:hypothetical protein